MLIGASTAPAGLERGFLIRFYTFFSGRTERASEVPDRSPSSESKEPTENDDGAHSIASAPRPRACADPREQSKDAAAKADEAQGNRETKMERSTHAL
jgi:hypothetical protein